MNTFSILTLILLVGVIAIYAALDITYRRKQAKRRRERPIANPYFRQPADMFEPDERAQAHSKRMNLQASLDPKNPPIGMHPGLAALGLGYKTPGGEDGRRRREQIARGDDSYIGLAVMDVHGFAGPGHVVAGPGNLPAGQDNVVHHTTWAGGDGGNGPGRDVHDHSSSSDSSSSSSYDSGSSSSSDSGSSSSD